MKDYRDCSTREQQQLAACRQLVTEKSYLSGGDPPGPSAARL